MSEAIRSNGPPTGILTSGARGVFVGNLRLPQVVQDKIYVLMCEYMFFQ